ncbi:hypothetical protein [Uliginosibacterium sp. H1]|uniref:hypothetical protein n=1 Tax=Uliginosibacterium sp. H1 TaxID=3114757 RepID=UPI002E17CB61|nr:hypothetical protein [Uliginosibacterium sp. H1]
MKNKENIWFLMVAILIGGVFVLPAVVFGSWFPLDMPALFKVGRDFAEWIDWIVNPNTGSGRYVPVYWLYYCAHYYLFGSDPTGYYGLMALIFFLAALGWCWTFARTEKSKLAALALLVLIFAGSPIAENIYTVGKPEPLAFFFTTAILLVFFLWRPVGRSSAWIKYATISLLFVLALWAKETSLALISFSFFGLFVAGVLRFRNLPSAKVVSTKYGALSASFIAGFLMSRIPHVVMPELGTNDSYVDYSITLRLIRENAEFYIVQQPDVLMFGVLAAIFAVWLCAELFKRTLSETQVDSYVFMAGLCALGWAFYLALLIWRWPMAYYMLFPSVLFKVCTVYGWRKAWLLGGRSWGGWSAVPLGLMSLATVYGVLVFYYVGMSQLQYSAIYTKAVHEYAKRAGPADDLVIESYPFFSEQIGATGDFVEFSADKSRTIKGIADVLDPAVTSRQDILDLLKITPVDLENNYRNFPGEGDFVLVFTGRKIAHWFLRGVAPYYSEDSILKTSGAYEMDLVSAAAMAMPALFVSLWDWRPKFELTSVGYKLYRVKENAPRFVWRGMYPDSWVGGKATLKINESYPAAVVAKMSVPSYGLPSTVVISKDGHPFKTVDFRNTDEKTILLSSYEDRVHVYEFSTTKTVVPADLGLNRDKRRLGFRLSLDRGPSSDFKSAVDR